MIEFEDVSVTYAQGRMAIEKVALRINHGEFVFVVGATGAGKSTFLKLLYREEIATLGKVLLDSRDLAKLPEHEVPFLRRQMGVVFQDFGLLPNKTLFENVAYALRVIGAGRKEIRRKVPAALELVGMVDRCDAFPGQISGGEQQRVAIARALVNMPMLLIADEPTGNLDPETSVGIYEVLERINSQGTTVIVATHDKQIVDRARKRVLEFDGGKLVRDQSDSLYDSHEFILELPNHATTPQLKSSSQSI